MLESRTVAIPNIAHFPLLGGDSEGPTCFGGHPPNINARILQMRRNHNTHDITPAKVMFGALLLRFTARKAQCVYQAPLPFLAAVGLHQPGAPIPGAEPRRR